MRCLASEGLIVIDSHRIGMVRRPDREEMEEIVEIRNALESFAIRRAMESITEAELLEARHMAGDMSEQEDPGVWSQIDIQFHSIFHEATQTRQLSHLLLALEQAGGIYVAQAQQMQPELRRRAISHHLGLIDAFAVGDIDKAIRIQHDHVRLPLEVMD
jgi:DNA-binding GntR family transcriptional regulator